MKNISENQLLNTKLSRTFKRQAGRFFTLLCIGIGVALTVSAQDNAPKVNIVTNGSFEQKIIVGGKSTPEGWGFFGTTNTITGAYMMDGDQQVHSGTRAVSITVPPPDTAVNGMRLSGPIEVKPGAAYSVEGWIKTSKCTEGTGKGAWLWVTAAEDQNGKPGNVIGGSGIFVTGTQDWRESSTQIYIPRNIRRLRIACRLDGSGTASFDDVTISRIE